MQLSTGVDQQDAPPSKTPWKNGQGSRGWCVGARKSRYLLSTLLCRAGRERAASAGMLLPTTRPSRYLAPIRPPASLRYSLECERPPLNSPGHGMEGTGGSSASLPLLRTNLAPRPLSGLPASALLFPQSLLHLQARLATLPTSNESQRFFFFVEFPRVPVPCSPGKCKANSVPPHPSSDLLVVLFVVRGLALDPLGRASAAATARCRSLSVAHAQIPR